MTAVIRAAAKWKNLPRRNAAKRGQHEGPETDDPSPNHAQTSSTAAQSGSLSSSIKNLPAPIKRVLAGRKQYRSPGHPGISPDPRSLPPQGLDRGSPISEEDAENQFHGIQVHGRRTSFSAELANGFVL